MRNLRIKPFALVTLMAFVLCVVVVSFVTGKQIIGIESAVVIGYKAIPLLVALAVFFGTHAWKWRIFRGWLVPFPDLNGTWQGVLTTTWERLDAPQPPPPIPAILTIKQSFTRISCVMRTAEMTSRSFLADFWLDGDEQIRMLGYNYRSDPSPLVGERSPPHSGTAIFEIVGKPVAKLNGRYWTTRGTAGEITLTLRERELVEEFPHDLPAHPVSGKRKQTVRFGTELGT